MLPVSPRARFVFLGICFAAAAAVPLAAFDPATTWWFPSCPFFGLTGLLCPLCGSLRALHALLTGAPLAALAFNPLAITALAASLVARRKAAAFLFSTRGVALALAFGIVRNIPPAWLVH